MLRWLPVLLVLASVAGCAPQQTCASLASTGSAPQSRRSTFRATECTDRRTYSVSCLLPASGPYRCTCEIGGRSTGQTFQRPQPLPHSASDPRHVLEIVNTQCSWSLHH